MKARRRITSAALLLGGAGTVQAQCPELDLRFAAPRQAGITSLAVFDAGSGARLLAGGGFPSLTSWNGERWETIPGAESTSVRALLVHDFGSGPELVVAGDFGTLGGVAASRVARWNGSAWSAMGAGLGTGPGEYVFALASFGSGSAARVVATGTFASSGATPIASVAIFDGSAWQPLGAGLDGNGFALSSVDFGSGAELVVGGQFASAGGVPAANIARWNGASWSVLGGGTDGSVTALCALGAPGSQALIVGGAFAQAGGVPAGFVARFDGAGWSAFGPGLTASSSPFAGVSALIPDGAGFVAGGRFEAPTMPPSANVARWDGSAWQPFAGGLGMVTYVGVDALARFDPLDGDGSRIFAAGSFLPLPGQPHAIAQWSGTSWNALRDDGAQGLILSGGASGAVSATLWQGELVVAGEFDGAGSAPAAIDIARFDGTTWHPLGTSPASTYIDRPTLVRALEYGTGPELVLGMSRNSTHDALVPLYRWNGTDWLPFLPGALGPDVDTRVLDVAAFDDGGGVKLYASGNGLRARAGGVADTVVRWDGAAWSRLDSGATPALDGMVLRLFVFDDGSGSALYAGGTFAGGVRRWSGTSWGPVGAGFSAPPGITPHVADFEVFDDGAGPRLYAGGAMHTSGGVALNGIARWNGVAWEAVPGWGAAFSGVMGFDVYDDGSGAGERLVAMRMTDELVAFDGVAWTSLAHTDPYFTFANVLADESLPGGGGIAILGNFQTVFEPGEPAHAQAGITILRGCPRVASFCSGDGLDAQLTVACPCSNPGASGHGCAWSASGTNLAGGHLSSSGSPVTDDLVLLGDSMTASGSSLFFQGAPNPSGVVFGDGLRCAASPTVRLRTRANVGGAAQVPIAGEPPLSSIAGVVPGSGVVRAYQVWFRVSASFCTSAAFNTTNALRVHW